MSHGGDPGGSASRTVRDRLCEVRREFHRYPEPAWCEFAATARVVEYAERIGVDELRYGSDITDPENRLSVPPEAELERWLERARARGVDPDVLERLHGGHTGAVAVLERGPGPTIALRVDIDALHVTESDDPDHRPTAEGFRSENQGLMHACGHDGHATIGLGVLEAVKESDFSGTLKVLFQPAEEVAGGAKAMATGGCVDDVDSLLAVHLGLDRPTGTVVAGVVKTLAVRRFRVEFSGTSAHAAKNPEAGDNAIQAAVSAASDLYAIPRHGGGATRVNVGHVEGGAPGHTNVVADRAAFEAEVRGEETELMEYMFEECSTVIRTAAERHGCDVSVTVEGEAPREDSDPATAGAVEAAARAHPDVTETVPSADFGASEDATYLMKRVKENGGNAAYAVVGTNHPGGHHSPTFDIDERSLDIAVDVLSDAVVRLGGE
ncbi:amidohydrolase [Halogeometricum sp. S1BR25-6]|uniref:Amidohydrolase n=1 Tax=Halogeometricum salsisoli TaxID=2950536 RepID=A0ABU2GJ43_9EURY|nr:amidohydrolase [Halogeometricum sp. S1BR25-6]MDS0300847.1 amidohydrolase [Halogeometricum sp. S1BR25-6]